jgi:hypothetical protein
MSVFGRVYVGFAGNGFVIWGTRARPCPPPRLLPPAPRLRRMPTTCDASAAPVSAEGAEWFAEVPKVMSVGTLAL